jgi:hypothetical protein
MDEPQLANARRLRELPKCSRSRTETAPPKRAAAKTLTALPSDPTLLKLKELPRATQSSTLMVDPKRVEP